MKIGLLKGNIFFLSLTGVAGSIYNEADSSMEASDGLNPVSSQGYAEVQAVEALSLAAGKQINLRMPRAFKDVAPPTGDGSA